jgi:hypothetical protein
MSSDHIPNALNPTGRSQNSEHVKAIAQTRLEHIRIMQKLESLLANEGFQFFVEHFQRGTAFCQGKASDIDTLDTEKREAYAQRFFAMNEMLAWPEKQLEASRGIVANIEREFGKQAEA